MKVRLAYYGRNYDRAAVLPSEIELPEESTLREAVAAVQAAMPGSPLPSSCLISVAGAHVGTVADHPPRQLRDGDELLFLSPVAGG